MPSEIITNPQRWNECLNEFARYDIYHLLNYYKATDPISVNAENVFLFRHENSEGVFALPFIRRPINSVINPGGKFDAASAYGYPGLLVSCCSNNLSQASKSEFAEALKTQLRGLDIISLFIRQNPVLQNDEVWTGTDIVRLGETVILDLNQSADERRNGYSKSHRYELRRALRSGISVRQREFKERIDTFHGLYTQTMNAVGAAKEYFFDREYFKSLAMLLPDNILYLEALNGGNVCGATLFFRAKDIVQYHLSARIPVSGNLSPTIVLLDEAFGVAKDSGAILFHLGGGVGAVNDSLSHFKRGFSNTARQYSTVRLIADETCYNLVCDLDAKIRSEAGCSPASESFFPRYRAPLIPK